MDSILDISDCISEDYQAAEIDFFDLIPWTPNYVASLGEDWILESGSPDPDHARSLVTIMVYIAEETTAVVRGSFIQREVPATNPISVGNVVGPDPRPWLGAIMRHEAPGQA